MVKKWGFSTIVDRVEGTHSSPILTTHDVVVFLDGLYQSYKWHMYMLKDGCTFLVGLNLVKCAYLADASPTHFTMCSKIVKLVARPNFSICDFSCTLQIVGFRASNITSRKELKTELGKEKWKGVACPQLQNWDQKAKYSKSEYRFDNLF
jgi:hypothetical protein